MSGRQSIQRIQNADRRPTPERQAEVQKAHEVDYRARRLDELRERVQRIMDLHPFDRVAQYDAMVAFAQCQGIGVQTLVNLRAELCDQARLAWVKPITHYVTR